MKNPVIIIGGMAVGMTAAAKIKREKPSLPVMVFDIQEEIGYGACSLPFYISGEISRDNLFAADADKLRAKYGIQIFLQTLVYDFSPYKKEISFYSLKTGETDTYKYSKLIYAGGASPNIPFENNFSEDITVTLKTIKDADKIKTWINNSKIKKIAVIGAGTIGIEMTEAFVNSGKYTALFESKFRILSYFSKEITSVVFKDLIDKKCRIHLGAEIQSVKYNRNEDSFTVYFDDKGETFDRVLIAAGNKPNNKLLQNTGISLDKKGYVIVDSKMQTSIDSVYAGGDSALVKHKVLKKNVYFPLGSTANKQARVIAENIVGKSSRFSGITGTIGLKFGNYQIAKTGINCEDAEIYGIKCSEEIVEGFTKAKNYPDSKEIKMKIYYSPINDKLLGGEIITEEVGDKTINVISSALHSNLKITDLHNADFVYTPPIANVWDPLLICINKIVKKTV